MDGMLLLKATVLLSAILLAARLLRRAPAASRHRLWTVAFAGILALPLLAFALPTLYVPMPAFATATAGEPTLAKATAGEPTLATATAGKPSDDSPASSIAPASTMTSSTSRFVRPSARAVLVTIWVSGTLAAAAALLLSLIRVRRLVRTAEEMGDPSWIAAAREVGARLGLRRAARLLVSPAVGTPMAGGVWRPAIFLPSSARGWSTEQRDVVLAHELAHLAGQDPLRHVAARLAVALYWFHPLAWMAARQATAAREQACDEAVLALGTRPSDYARVLVELAETMQPSAAPLAALPMVERSHLETRVMAILKNDPPSRLRSLGGASRRTATRPGMLIPPVVVALCTLVLASVQPGVQASPVSMTIVTPPSAAPAVTADPMRPSASPFQFSGDSACASEWRGDANFRGRTDSRIINGRTVVMERVGTSGADRIIQESFGDLRVCMVAEGAGPAAGDEKPSSWVGRARRVVLETLRGNRHERLEVAPYGIGQRVSWQVDGKDRSLDANAEQWRDRLLSTLDAVWEISRVHGEVSNLHGEISNIHGEESNLRGQISNLRGEVSNLHGQISNIHGEESNLRGQISNIRGHVSSLQGAISSEQGSISSLRAGGYRLDDTGAVRDALKRHENEIARLEQEIRDYGADAKVAAVERDIIKLNAAKQVEAIEAEIRKFDLDGKVAAIEKQIAGLDVNGKIARLQKEISALDVDGRVPELEKRRDDELKRLLAALAALR